MGIITSKKAAKDILIQYHDITNFISGSPREVLKRHFQQIKALNYNDSGLFCAI